MPGERLTQQDRRQIAAGLRDGLTYAAIGRRIGRPTSTVTREVMRNGGPNDYRADLAHRAGTRTERRTGAAPVPADRAGFGGRDPRVVHGVAAHSAELFTRTGLPRMAARVLAALLTTDSGSLTSAELVRRLRVSPASVSKAVNYLEAIGVLHRDRDPRGRAERYAVHDDAWFQAITVGSRIDAEIAAACRAGARRLGASTPAGTRLDHMGRFLQHVSDDLVRSAEHWRGVLAARPDDTATR
ncbi:GbsR/MarR family transcriptional regulator [Saccharothrix obliqua]|uniref:GbsR/MarR family transcriptional regulator n=1 Tax=Saccharothrix obliqua TaxID=2861747 RepID=UPI001C5CC843|nr:helix-turn-helix domain-containing protein [Saccharothrix obliqua]MBW4716597.1 helix-turn-helix domain-containing protein [Saccharothrix obliqua]